MHGQVFVMLVLAAILDVILNVQDLASVWMSKFLSWKLSVFKAKNLWCMGKFS